MASSTQEEGTLTYETAGGDGQQPDNDDNGVLFEKIWIPPPGAGVDPKLNEVYQELMDHMKHAEEHQPHRSGDASGRRTQLNDAETADYFSDYTLSQLMGHFDQIEREKKNLSDQEDEELKRIQGLGLFSKGIEQEKNTEED